MGSYGKGRKNAMGYDSMNGDIMHNPNQNMRNMPQKSYPVAKPKYAKAKNFHGNMNRTGYEMGV